MRCLLYKTILGSLEWKVFKVLTDPLKPQASGLDPKLTQITNILIVTAFLS